MAHSINYFSDFEPYQQKLTVFLGENSTKDIICRGQVAVKLIEGNIRTIMNVFHIPALKKKLFSIEQFDLACGTL